MITKITRWIVFGVLVSLVPLVYAYVNLLIKAKPANIKDVILNGELLILVGAMCAGAIGEVIGSNSGLKLLKILLGGTTLILLILSMTFFGSITEARLAGSSLDLDYIERMSIVLFITAFISCGCCIILSET